MPEKYYPSKRTYFPNLDGLRFIGSLIIIIFHIEGIKARFGRPTNSILRYYNPVGNIDVSLFFVLSGFLITYLLLKEKKESGTIKLKAYYARRTLRIWPLYYLVLITGSFVLPHFYMYFNNNYTGNLYKHFWLYFFGCALFLAPLVRSAAGLNEAIGPIWSVAVEELFYLCWPLFLRKTKRYLLIFFTVIFAVLLLRNGFFLANYFFDFGDSFHKLIRPLTVLIMEYRISCMAIGGIGAYLVVFEKNKILSLLYRKDVQLLVYVLTIGLLLLKVGVKPIFKEDFPNISNEMYSVLFTIIIINLATNPRSVLRLDYKWMTYLGKVSYGLYLYHPIMRILSMELTEHLFKREVSGWQMNVCLYFLTIASTIVISIISYEFFEKKFLNLKKKFAG